MSNHQACQIYAHLKIKRDNTFEAYPKISKVLEQQVKSRRISSLKERRKPLNKSSTMARNLSSRLVIE